MDPLDVAAELCGLVRQPNLAAWLGIDPASPAEDAREALQRKRRVLQGMLANPKHQREAAFVVRSYPALERALARLDEHVADMARRAEALHVPALELLIDGVLAAGPLDPAREAQLRRGVAALGVREETFQRLLEGKLRQPVAPRPTAPTPSGGPTLYALLGVPVTAGADEIHDAAARRLADQRVPTLAAQLRIAEDVLSHPAARRLYDRLNGIAPAEAPPADLYTMLGIRPTAAAHELEAAFEGRLARLALDDPERHRLEVAWRVLRHRGARARYDDASQPSRPRLLAAPPAPRAPSPEPPAPARSTLRSALVALAAGMAVGVGALIALAVAVALWLAR